VLLLLLLPLSEPSSSLSSAPSLSSSFPSDSEVA
jgi:hypothetical protein